MVNKIHDLICLAYNQADRTFIAALFYAMLLIGLHVDELLLGCAFSGGNTAMLPLECISSGYYPLGCAFQVRGQ